MSRRACEALAAEERLMVIESANHLFEEPGTLDAVVREATRWFLRICSRGRKILHYDNVR
jgi:hypothetical protein